MSGGSHRRAPSLAEETAWAAACAVAARTWGVRLAEVLDTRGRATRASGKLLLARRSALYLAATGANLSRRALQRASGMDHSTVTHHLAAVEDDRETRAGLDVLLDELTQQLQAVAPIGRAA